MLQDLGHDLGEVVSGADVPVTATAG
jgi:hypothetical protein